MSAPARRVLRLSGRRAAAPGGGVKLWYVSGMLANLASWWPAS